MTHVAEQRSSAISRVSRMAILAGVLVLGSFAAEMAQGQTLQVLHSFTGGSDGQYPFAGLTIDRAGNLYGTTAYGGNFGGACGPQQSFSGCGTVFKLTHRGSGWTFAPLYAFKGFAYDYDAANPAARVVFGPDGSLYGTTASGGYGSCRYFGYGCGTVFKLSPPATVCKTVLCPWTDTVLYDAAQDSGEDLSGDVVFDSAGNLYSTVALGGGLNADDYVFELTPSNGGWTSQVIYSFIPNDVDCTNPMAGLVFDASGNLYGTANNGCGQLYGGVFQLSPSESGWTENILLRFNGIGNGDGSEADLTPDGHGGFFGTTVDLGPSSGGTVFNLTPSDGGWAYSLVYGFGVRDGAYPTAPVTLDASGNLYGTTGKTAVDSGNGLVFELSPSNGGWTETVLHYFLGTDGLYPSSNVVMDANGNLYGTTSQGGDYGYGVVWEITP